jgi:hypothetical protein
MKKPTKTRSARLHDDLLPEYNFDYSKARPNRFAGRLQRDRVLVTLDPDVSSVFGTSQSVNTALRAIMAALPKRVVKEHEHGKGS